MTSYYTYLYILQPRIELGFESKSSEQNFSGCCCADDKSDGMVDFGFKNEYHKEHI